MEEGKIEKLKSLVGDALLYCQALEHDLKIIYSCYTARSLEQIKQKNSSLSDKNLGYIINLLAKNGQIDKEGTNVLNQVRTIRNYLAHNVFTEVIYLQPSERDIIYSKVYTRVENDRNRMAKVMKQIEMERIRAVKEITKGN
jgi:hypothetical protein